MSRLNKLKNTGVLVVNPPQEDKAEKTVVVLGLARGGTTMVASVVKALGVSMGEKLGPVLEDTEISKAVESRDKEKLREIVKCRDSAYPIWGWKRPSAFEFTDVWQGMFRNPHMIVIFRDPFSIANRNRISMLMDVFHYMSVATRKMGLLVEFIEKQKCPVLLCSYEKVLSSPETFVHAVDEFLGLNASSAWESAIQKIQPSPEEYLETSRITHSKGCLDQATEKVCSGWAFYPSQPKRPANLTVFINNQPVVSAVANLPHPDLKEAGEHPTGHCGFRVEWPPNKRPKIGDLVSVTVEGDIESIDGSPQEIVALTRSPSTRAGN